MNRSIPKFYTKSEAPRQRWNSDLHRCFVQVIEQLGGEREATPKKILELMGGRGLTMSHVKSHLQMYRNIKKKESIQENTVIEEMRWSQSQQNFYIYERHRVTIEFMQNQRRSQCDNSENIIAFLKSSHKVEVSSSSSSRIGRNEIGDDGVVVASDGALKTEVSSGDQEELSLELTLGLKY